MNILIPMAGEGKRFLEAGYAILKPAIPVIDWRSGEEMPMVVCAVKDFGFADEKGSNLIFVIRETKETGLLIETIRQNYPDSKFIYADKATEGQACTCLLAKELINNNDELFIGSCDNGMIYDYNRLISEMQVSDAIAFTYCNCDAVLLSPNSYGWLYVDNNNFVTDTSIKKAISDNPLKDHAITGAFWFKRGCEFVKSAEEMIAKNDRINGEFYVDLVLKYMLQSGMKVKAFEIGRYLGWGTPADYEKYQKTYNYWRTFAQTEAII